MQVSCYSLAALAKHAAPLMIDGGSIITLTYLGAMKCVPNYNVMGVAKAALEASVRYLAADLGKDNIRVNAISAGPIRTLAASAIGDFKSMLDAHSATAPLKRNVSQEDVAGAATYLLSDLSRGVTGEIHYVDAGYNIMGARMVAE
jgi:enoyl-[acyl-carrier protein] reductase I